MNAVGQQAGATAATHGAPGRGQRPWRRWLMTALVMVLVAAGAGSAALAGVFRTGTPKAAAPSPGTSTAAVTRQTLVSQTSLDAALGYAGSYTVSGKGGGTLTWLPAPGRMIRQGGVLYRTGNQVPVILLYGKVPAWRALSEGLTGQDVAQLNHGLVALGYASSTDIATLGWDYFGWDTKYAVERLQTAVGMTTAKGTATGTLPLGSVVFEPSALRVGKVPASLGNPAAGAIFTATSARRVVTISLDASQQDEVKPGDKVSVTLPDGKTTPGVISSVGKVATTSKTSGTTVPVHVALTHPRAAGNLDQAPVTVTITTARARNVLVVPVGALLAQAGGGYAVEEVTTGGRHRLVPVTLGLFDDAAGAVQVSGNGLAAGQRVVVPSL